MIKIICLGKIKELYLVDLIADYLMRINYYHKTEIIELKDTNDLKEEAININKYLHPQDFIIVLDRQGKQIDSLQLAKKIDETLNYFSTIVFIIGSSNGLDQEIINKANLNISFSLLTYPHGLFRGILLEQIYRCFKIINNETYHK